MANVKLKYHHNPNTPKETIEKAERAVKNVLRKRTAKMGIGGEWSIKLEIKIGAKPIEKHLTVLYLTNLTEATAKLIFDLIDEQNTRTKKDFAEYKLILYQAEKEIDFNYLPNATTIYQS